jgi:hypothetical protein
MEEFSFYMMLLVVYLTCSMNRIRVPSFVDSVLRRGLQFSGFHLSFCGCWLVAIQSLGKVLQATIL